MPNGHDSFGIPELFPGVVLLVTIGVVLRALLILLSDRRNGRQQCLRTLRALVIGLGMYVALVLLLSFVPPDPPHATPLGSPLCLARAAPCATSCRGSISWTISWTTAANAHVAGFLIDRGLGGPRRRRLVASPRGLPTLDDRLSS